jgi:hypothetical protein
MNALQNPAEMRAEITSMTPDEIGQIQPTEPEEVSWREVEEDLLAQARELSRSITEKVRSITRDELSACPTED